MRGGETQEELWSSQFSERRRILLSTTPLTAATSLVTPKEKRAQRGSVTCLRSHSLAVTKQDLEAGLPALPTLTRQERGRSSVQDALPHPSAFGFPDLESIYLEDGLPSSPSQDDSLLAFSSPGLSPDGWPSPEEPPVMAAAPQLPSPEQQHRQRLPGGPGPEGGTCLQGSVPSVDSGSLSEEEDEVFYN